MRHNLPIFVSVLLVSWICLPSSLWADSPATTQPSIVASTYHYDAATQTLRAEGEVEAMFGDLTLRSPVLLLNLSQDSLEALGGIELTAPWLNLKGRQLTYDLRSRSGSILDAEGRIIGPPAGAGEALAWPLRLTASRLQLGADSLVLSDGKFTLCDAPEPHFWLEADKLSIVPGESVTLSSGGLRAYGRRLVRFPRYTFSLRERGRLPTPMLGYNKGWGAFVGFSAPLLAGQGEVALSGKAGLVGEWTASGRLREEQSPAPVWDEWQISFARRQDAHDPFDSSLLLDIYPSVTLAGRANSLGELRATYARIRELPTQVRRQKAEIRWLGPEKRIGRGKTTLTLRPQAWHNGYSEGEEYKGIALEAQAKTDLGPGRNLSLTYVHNAVEGSTPFEYDDVDVMREVRAGFRWRIGPKWAVGIQGRYDVESGESVDNSVTVEAIQHCLTYSLQWREARRQLNLAVGLSAGDY